MTIPTDTQNRLVVYAKMWTSHASYSPTTRINNIAIVYLPADVYHTTKSAVANLFYKDPTVNAAFDANFATVVVKIVGWGLNGNTGSTSNTLKEGEMQITSRANCDLAYPTRTTKEICLVPTATTPTQVHIFINKLLVLVLIECLELTRANFKFT